MKADAARRSAAALDERAAHILRSSKIKATEVRTTVVKALLSHPKRKFAARELVEQMVIDEATVSVASGYRVLRELQEAGILVRQQTRYGRVWYQLNDARQRTQL